MSIKKNRGNCSIKPERDSALKVHVGFLKQMCQSGGPKSLYAKTWAGMTVDDRKRLDTALRCMSEELTNDLCKDTETFNCAHPLRDYFNCIFKDLREGVAPKLIVIALPATKPAKPKPKPISNMFTDDDEYARLKLQAKEFIDDHLSARRKLQELVKLLYHKAVAEYGHRAVQYMTSFSQSEVRRCLDVYGNPKATPFKVRIVNAMNNTKTSRGVFNAAPWSEAEVTVVFARSYPRKNKVREEDVVLLKLRRSKSDSDRYRIVENGKFGIYHSISKSQDRTSRTQPKSVGHFRRIRKVADKKQSRRKRKHTTASVPGETEETQEQ